MAKGVGLIIFSSSSAGMECLLISSDNAYRSSNNHIFHLRNNGSRMFIMLKELVSLVVLPLTKVVAVAASVIK
jgi:hypothetical protein